MPNVISLCAERRKRAGQKPAIALLGLKSDAATLIKATLASVQPDERAELFTRLCSGTYRDMFVELASSYQIVSAKKP